MKVKRGLALTAAVVWAIVMLATTGPASGVVSKLFVSTAQFKAMGFNLLRGQPALLSPRGNNVFWVDKTSNKYEIPKGHVFRLTTMHLDWTTGKVTLQKMWLPTTNLDNLNISADGRTIAGVSDRGTRVFVVDVATQTSKVIYVKEKGKPSFDVSPSYVWMEKGMIMCPGIFFDSTNTALGDYIVSIDPSKTGYAAIKKVRNMNPITHHAPGGFQWQQYFDANESYFATMEADPLHPTHLYYGDGNELRLIDKTFAIGGMAVGQDRIVYCARYRQAHGLVYGLTVFDQMTGKKYHIGSPDIPYSYLYMSHDGRTILATRLHLHARTMSVYYGREGSDFNLRQVPGLHGVRPGVIRFSRDGSTVEFMGPRGMSVQRLPQN